MILGFCVGALSAIKYNWQIMLKEEKKKTKMSLARSSLSALCSASAGKNSEPSKKPCSPVSNNTSASLPRMISNTLLLFLLIIL